MQGRPSKPAGVSLRLPAGVAIFAEETRVFFHGFIPFVLGLQSAVRSLLVCVAGACQPWHRRSIAPACWGEVVSLLHAASWLYTYAAPLPGAAQHLCPRIGLHAMCCAVRLLLAISSQQCCAAASNPLLWRHAAALFERAGALFWCRLCTLHAAAAVSTMCSSVRCSVHLWNLPCVQCVLWQALAPCCCG